MFSSIDAAVEELKKGKIIIVCDDEGRENEGDFVALADKMTPETVNFMITYGKGLLCCPVDNDFAIRLGLEPMVNDNRDNHQTAFSQSIDHISCTTGISAYERSLTLNAIAQLDSESTDFRAPGHIFPLIAKKGGVLVRPGHTEAAVDLAKMSGNTPVGAICEIINEDGTMARLPELEKLAKVHNLKMIHIKELIKYRKRHEKLVTRVVETKLPSKFGNFNIVGYQSVIDNQEAVAIMKGEIKPGSIPLVRIHSECLTGDGFGSLRCDCGEQLAASLERIDKEGGILIYLRQEGRGIGLINKLKAYALQDKGVDTVEANLQLGFVDDARDYYLAAQILKDWGISQIRLMSNNPRKLGGLEDYGIKISGREKIIIPANQVNSSYLEVKALKLGHLFNK